MAKPFSRMDTENLEDTTKIGKKTKNTISSSFHQIDPSQTKKIIAASSKQELKTDESNYKKIDLSSQDLNYIPKYLFANSEVEELDLSNNPRLAEEKELVFPELNYLKKLNLSNCNFKNVPNQLLKFQQLEELNFSHNLLQFNFKLPTLGNLKKLDLSGCGLTEIPNDFLHWYELKELNMSNNSLNHSASFKFTHEYFWNLEKLDLSGCGLTEIPDDFRRCRRLKELNLSKNSLNHSASLKLTHEYFVHLEKLYLSGCGLTEIPDGPHHHCHSLKELNLSNNPLNHSVLFRFAHGYLWNLEKLDLSGCGLTKIYVPYHFSHWFVSLKELNLSSNPLEHSGRSTFEHFQKYNMQGLHLSDKSLDRPALLGQLRSMQHTQSLKVTFDDAVYILKNYDEDVATAWSVYPERASSPTRLTKIDVTGEGSRICGDRLESFKELRTDENNYKKLDLSSKDLNRIPDYLFANSEVEELNLSNNPRLAEEKDLVFPELKYLKKLNLSNCDFKNVPNELLKCQQLEELNLSNNPLNLSTLSKIKDCQLQELKKLDLSGCGVKELPRDFCHFWYKLEELNLSNNPLGLSAMSTLQDSNLFDRCSDSSDPLGKRSTGVYCEALSRISSLKVIFDEDAFYTKSYDEESAGETEGDREYCVPVIECGEQISDDSITVDEKGGCFCIPAASAFLVFPPGAVEEQVTLTYSRVMYKDCGVKEREDEEFVSRVLKLQPESMTFKKPVTVLLSHSAYEDQDFLDLYELIVKKLNPAGCQEMRTEKIRSIKDVPREIINPEVLDDYLPFAKATIYETCTLVAATRFKSDQIFVIPTNHSHTFSKKYGDNKELQITFPAGVAEKELCLTIQVFPADDVLNPDVYLDDNLVCVPVISVSGQTDPFLKPVDVELSYSHNDVASIDEEFLPVGKKVQFTPEFGLLMRSHKETESKVKWLPLNESNDVFIERLRKDKLKFSFSVRHFCKTSGQVKKNDDAQVSDVQESSSTRRRSRHAAVVLAVHETGTTPKRLNAVLAPLTSRRDVRERWQADPIGFPAVRCEEAIYFCVPLIDGVDDCHLSLTDYTLRFNPEIESVLPNNTKDNTDLRRKYMHFLINKRCMNGINHSTQGDCRAKAEIEIHNCDAGLVQANIDRLESQQAGHNASSGQEEVQNINNVQREKIMKDMLYCCQTFEKEIVTAAQEKLRIEEPKEGKLTKILSFAGPTTTLVVGLACGVTIAMGFSTFGVGSFVGAAVAGVTLSAIVEKKIRSNQPPKADQKFIISEEAEEIELSTVSSYLNCIVKEVAKELSHIFEYQLFLLRDKHDLQVKILAKCAVDLMFDLKEDDKFDRNTLLEKVLQNGSVKNSMKKKELRTRNGNKWFAVDVFRKPGLRRTSVGSDHVEFKYFVKPDHACDTQKYGYRGQFLEMKKYFGQIEAKVQFRKRVSEEDIHTCEDLELCPECFSYSKNCTRRKLRRMNSGTDLAEFKSVVKPDHACDTKQHAGGQNQEDTVEGAPGFADAEECYPVNDGESGTYFVESSIDRDYTQKCQEVMIYRPLHVLIQCPKILASFMMANLQAEPSLSLADFLKGKMDFHDGAILYPVYRQHSPGKVPHLTNADLRRSDFSHSDFTNASLEGCNFTECTMLFTKLAGAKMSGSKFNGTFISYSNLVNVKADRCYWIKTSVVNSLVDDLDLRGAITYGEIRWDESNTGILIIGPLETATNSSKKNHVVRSIQVARLPAEASRLQRLPRPRRPDNPHSPHRPRSPQRPQRSHRPQSPQRPQRSHRPQSPQRDHRDHTDHRVHTERSQTAV